MADVSIHRQVRRGRRHLAALGIACAALAAGLPSSPAVAAPAPADPPGIVLPDLFSHALRCGSGAIRDGRCAGGAPQRRVAGWTAATNAPAATPVAGAAVRPAAACPAIPAQDDWCERYVSRQPLGPQGVAETPFAMTLSSDGSELYALSWGTTSQAPGVAVVAFEAATGRRVRTLPVPFDPLGPASEFYPTLLAISPDAGTLYVAGSVCTRVETPEGFRHDHNYLTGALSAAGEPLWWSRYAGPTSGRCGGEEFDVPLALAVAPDGSRLYVTGVSTGTGHAVDGVPPLDVATVSYDATTGAQRWVERFDSGGPEFAPYLAVAGDSSAVYVAAVSWSGQFTVLAYGDTTGELDRPGLAWAHTEDPQRFSWPVGLQVAGERIVAAGVSTANASDTYDYAALALDRAGNRVWRSGHSHVYSIAGASYTSHDFPTALAVTEDAVYLTGLALEWDALHEAGDPAAAMVGSTVAFDLSVGALRWADSYAFPGHRLHLPTAVHVAGDRVYVPGMDSECNFLVGPGYWCNPSKLVNLVTLDYDAASGQLTQVARYNHNRGVGTEPALLSPGLSAATNWMGWSGAGPGGELYVSAHFESPCLDECLPGGRYRWGILSYP